MRHSAIVIIERQQLYRESLAFCLRSAIDAEVVAVESVAAWKPIAPKHGNALFVMCVPARGLREDFDREFRQLLALRDEAHAVALIGPDDHQTIIDALQKGAKGYFTTSMALDVTIAAMRFVSSGGTFVPAGSMLRATGPRPKPAQPPGRTAASYQFTARQAAVVQALCRGKANKIIAHELQLRESTVKVHVRKIMKKLKATNRTQVAFLARELVGLDAS